MATLTDADFTFYKRAIRRDPVARAEMRAALLSKSDWKALMQSIEDRWAGDVAGYKADADIAAKQPVSDALVASLQSVWIRRGTG